MPEVTNLIKRKILFGTQIWRFEGMKVYWPCSGDDHMVNGNGENMCPSECQSHTGADREGQGQASCFYNSPLMRTQGSQVNFNLKF